MRRVERGFHASRARRCSPSLGVPFALNFPWRTSGKSQISRWQEEGVTFPSPSEKYLFPTPPPSYTHPFFAPSMHGHPNQDPGLLGEEPYRTRKGILKSLGSRVSLYLGHFSSKTMQQGSKKELPYHGALREKKSERENPILSWTQTLVPSQRSPVCCLC